MAKTCSFATMHFTVAFGVTWLLTGDIVVGGLIALVEPAVNSVAYFFHEKLWTRLAKGNPDKAGPDSGVSYSAAQPT
ncbi:DUF2061 domain-containing protein [Teredinibacter waterburyi]|jgi:Predicted membrane protein|uniref:DUF2061 domain-containing protein n=1 Tax=Teredinibacter waterburyi TaxID=1500538 RepID=UPI00165F58C6|nr:DUF2061 domain-containing protein [Teredinibacter waterburyi]